MSAELSVRVLFLPHSAGAWCVGTNSFLSIVIVTCLVQRCEPLTQGHTDFFLPDIHSSPPQEGTGVSSEEKDAHRVPHPDSGT